MFVSCETETQEFPQIYGKVYFSEYPDDYDGYQDLNGTYGIVIGINYANNYVEVQIENNGQCFTFELDGSNWDKSGKFKREPWEYQGDIETCVNNETVNH